MAKQSEEGTAEVREHSEGGDKNRDSSWLGLKWVWASRRRVEGSQRLTVECITYGKMGAQVPPNEMREMNMGYLILECA